MAVLLWDLTKAERSSIIVPGSKIDARQLWMSPDGEYLWIAYASEMAYYTFAKKKTEAAIEVKGGGLFFQVSPDGKFIAAGGVDGQVSVFYTETIKNHAEYVVPVPPRGVLRGFAFHPKEPWLLAQYWPPGPGGFLRFLDLKEKREWDGPPKDLLRIDSPPSFWPQFSADGSVLGLGDRQVLHRFEVKDKKILIPLSPLGPLGSSFGFAFSPRGHDLATTSGEKGLVIWDAAKGIKKLELDLPYVKDGEMVQPFFAPDGRHLAIAYRDLVFLYRLEKAPEE